MWERWDSMLPDGSINPGEMTSFNHYALGSVANWLHSVVGGISPITPGWKDILFAPIPGGPLTSAKTKYLSPHGLVESEWKVNGETFRMKIRVPPNCEGVVELPYQGHEQIQRREVGSGVWEFETEWKGHEEEWPPKAIYDPFSQHDD
jgi:alpha-L-rhamnosidase